MMDVAYTDSGVYHKEGARYYGKTKTGKYMSEADAQRAGFIAAQEKKAAAGVDGGPRCSSSP
jgi:hypothetical protein